MTLQDQDRIRLTPDKLSAVGIYEEFHPRTLSNFPGNSKALEETTIYVQQLSSMRRRGRGLVFSGPYGVGKTSLAISVLKEAMAQGYLVRCTAWPLVIDARTSTWHDSKLRSRFLKQVYGPDFLQLDDLGKEIGAGKDLSISVLDMILRRRTARLRPTILTTNFPLAELRRVYGDAIASLLNGYFQPIQVMGEDMRGKHWEVSA